MNNILINESLVNILPLQLVHHLVNALNWGVVNKYIINQGTFSWKLSLPIHVHVCPSY
jgi:hypothetical protein